MPTLTKLDLEICDHRSVADPSTTHVRRIVIEQAPALFDIPCADPSCRDGGHELTYAVLRALRNQQTSFDGEDVCHGSVGTSSCGRTLRYVATAAFART